MSLAGILDDDEIVALCQAQDGIHVGRQAVQMDRDDRLGAWRDGCFDLAHVHVAGICLHVHQDRAGTGKGHRCGRGDKGVRRDDHLVTGADPECSKAQLQGRQSAVHAYSVSRAAEFGKLLLELGYLLAQGKVGPLHDPPDGFVELLLEGAMLYSQIDEWHVHHSLLATACRARTSDPST
jgi:hypothetical protein